MSPRSGRQPGELSAVARFAGSITIRISSWGLRPRLYAVARFAGLSRTEMARFAGLSRTEMARFAGLSSTEMARFAGLSRTEIARFAALNYQPSPIMTKPAQ